MRERDAYIALNMMAKVGPVTVRSLKERLGSAAAIFEVSKADMRSADGVGAETSDAIVRQRETIDWCGEIERAESQGVRVVTAVDKEYPAALLQIYDPPLALYVKGELKDRDRHSIAVVGTRHPTHYGMETTRRLSGGLARAGFTVNSGLALGVDTHAHQTVVEAKGRTIAVLGGAIDRLYPKANAALADRIADGCGAVVSEFPLGRDPDKTTFPMRNRIVSGLSMGVLVIEAGDGSGALITSDQAAEQGRTVFAVPGRIDSPMSQGTNRLLKNGARLVMDVQDILDEFEMLIPAGSMVRKPAASVRPKLSTEEQAIADALTGGGMDVDGLIRICGLKPAVVGALLTGLEMKRVLKVLPGRMVELIGN